MVAFVIAASFRRAKQWDEILSKVALLFSNDICETPMIQKVKSTFSKKALKVWWSLFSCYYCKT